MAVAYFDFPTILHVFVMCFSSLSFSVFFANRDRGHPRGLINWVSVSYRCQVRCIVYQEYVVGTDGGCVLSRCEGVSAERRICLLRRGLPLCTR